MADRMSFIDLVRQLKGRLPGENFQITVEYDQSKIGYRACEHLPKTTETLLWKIWDGKKYFEGETAIDALKNFDESRIPKEAQAPDPGALAAVNAHETPF